VDYISPPSKDRVTLKVEILPHRSSLAIVDDRDFSVTTAAWTVRMLHNSALVLKQYCSIEQKSKQVERDFVELSILATEYLC
jgi:hypothetical protein